MSELTIEENNVASNVSSEIVGDFGENKKNDFDDIFVSEEEEFDVCVRYYSKDNEIHIVGLEAEENSDDIKEIKFIFRQPNYGDCELISKQTSIMSGNKVEEDYTLGDYVNGEIVRMLSLFKTWNGTGNFNIDLVRKINPKIVKDILMKIRLKIGMIGIASSIT